MGAGATTAGRAGRIGTDDRRALVCRIDRRATTSQGLANVVGALDVALLLFFVLPGPAEISLADSWQRNAIACTRAPDRSSIRSRRFSSGARAYRSGSMPDTLNWRSATPYPLGWGRLRAATRANNSSTAAQTSSPPANPFQYVRTSPTSS